MEKMELKPTLDDWGDMLYPATQAKSVAGQDQLSLKELVDKDFKCYIDSPASKDTHAINWWSIMKDKMPKLAILANKYLCAPPSSVESERLFSIGGRVYTPLRNRLKPENGEMLMMLCHKIRHFNF